MKTGARGGARGSRYRLFGLTLETDFAFRTPLPTTDAAPDLRFTCTREAPGGDAPPATDPAFTSRGRLESGAPTLTLYRRPGSDLIRYTEVADFHLDDDRIHCHLLDPRYDYMVEIHLLGLVFAYWFERRGIPVLHASGVSVDGRAAVFIATNKGGKSSLAGGLMRAGHPLLSDDVIGIQSGSRGFEGRPGFPSMRLWPDQAAHFHEDWEGLGLAHPRFDKRLVPVGDAGFGSFHDAPAPLGALYLPDRRPSRAGDPVVELIPLSPREAVLELVRGSFLPRLVQEVGLAPARLATFARLAAAVPVKRLVYPEGVAFLPTVCAAIEEDLRSAEESGPALPPDDAPSAPGTDPAGHPASRSGG